MPINTMSFLIQKGKAQMTEIQAGQSEGVLSVIATNTFWVFTICPTRCWVLGNCKNLWQQPYELEL